MIRLLGDAVKASLLRDCVSGHAMTVRRGLGDACFIIRLSSVYHPFMLRLCYVSSKGMLIECILNNAKCE